MQLAPALPATDWQRWLLIPLAMAAWLLILYVTGNLAWPWERWSEPWVGSDWQTFERVSRLDNPYDDWAWRWSPVAAWIMSGIFVPLGLEVWRILQIASLGLLRSPWLIGAFLVFAPFWGDVLKGNSMIFVAVAALLATRGSRPATIAFYAMAMLIPRPLMLPGLAWLLWKEPWSRRWFLGIAVAHALLVLASGFAGDFAMRLAVSGQDQVREAWTWGVGEMGPLGIVGGLLGAAVLTRLGWLGAASVLAQPYIIDNYLLMLMLDVRRIGEAVWRRLALDEEATRRRDPVGARHAVRKDELDVVASR